MITFHLKNQNINKTPNISLPCTSAFWPFWVSTTSLKVNCFISNCFMPSWFMCFCFSAFHRCHITQRCALEHLHRFLQPCSAKSPCLRFSCNSCLHTLLTSLRSTCPANWAKLEWMCLHCRWTSHAPGLCHSCLAVWCYVFCWRGRFKYFSEGRTKFH